MSIERSCENCYLFEKCDLSEVTNISCEQYKPKEPQEVECIFDKGHGICEIGSGIHCNIEDAPRCPSRIVKGQRIEQVIRNRAIDEMVEELQKHGHYLPSGEITLEQIAERLKGVR